MWGYSQGFTACQIGIRNEEVQSESLGSCPKALELGFKSQESYEIRSLKFKILELINLKP